MAAHLLLGQLHSIQHLLLQLLESVDDDRCRRQFHPHLSPLACDPGRAPAAKELGRPPENGLIYCGVMHG